jgi:hypothetical protein
MATRILAAAVLSAVVMFFWGFVFWALSGLPSRFLLALPQTTADDVTAVLRRDKLPSGVYVFPMPADPRDAEAVKANEDIFRAGPRFQLAHRLEGDEPMGAATLGRGFGHMFVVGLMASLLTAMALPGLATYGRRATFVAILGFFGAIWTNPGDVVWWFHSREYCLGEMFYGVVAGLLMAVVVAAIVKPTATKA